MNTDEIRDADRYRKGWTGGLPETECGAGSKLANTVRQRQWLSEFFKKHGIKSIVDVGAGDLNWIRHMDLSGIEYTPLDIVPRHESVKQFNLLEGPPPAADCVLCLWVLNHLPYDDCKVAISNLLASGSKYLVMTDRPKFHPFQPPEIKMQALDALLLNDKGDRIKAIRLGGSP